MNDTIYASLTAKASDFKEAFLGIRHSAYDPGYRLRYVLGRIENTLLAAAGMPPISLKSVNSMQVEHILPQTPKAQLIPAKYAAGTDDYRNLVYRLGNVTLLESTINQAVNNFNDLSGDWFRQKQAEYVNSSLLSAKLLDHNFAIGVNTAANRLKTKYAFEFQQWDRDAIVKRQAILLDLALETWKINDKRIDQPTTE